MSTAHSQQFPGPANDVDAPITWMLPAGQDQPATRGKAYHWGKRVFDVLAASLLFICLSPLLLIVALLIKLDSRGQVIYKQERMGYDSRTGKPKSFVMHKFRSMRQGNDESVHQEFVKRWAHDKVDPEVEAGKLANDTRITRIGQLLRKTSVDELPQLWDVLRGDMSLVGPRPVPLYEVKEYKPWHYGRLYATPGLTGLWQVEARGQSGLDEMARLDLEYIHKRSLGYDIKLLLLTLPSVIRKRGAR